MITVSIITPTYNRGEKLKQVLPTVLSQSYKNIEHIIVDNLSTDETQEIINEYKIKAPYPVIFISEKDSGIANAMNKGITFSSGRWVHILNSDDYYYSSYCLEEIFKNKDLDEYDVLAFPIVVKDEISGKISQPWIPYYNKKIEHYNFPHTGLIIKRDFYFNCGLYDEKFKLIADAVFGATNFPNSKFRIFENPVIVIAPDSGVSNRFSITRSRELFIFTISIYKGALKYKIKYLILNFYRDILLILKEIKKSYKEIIIQAFKESIYYENISYRFSWFHWWLFS